MIVLPIAAKRDVTSVTVIEREAQVIRLVLPQLEAYSAPVVEKVRVQMGDVEHWQPATRGRQFDTIYHDIWPDFCADNLPEMARLRRRYSRWLRPCGYQRCWSESYLEGFRR